MTDSFGVNILPKLFGNSLEVSLGWLLGLAGCWLAHDEMAISMDIDSLTWVVS